MFSQFFSPAHLPWTAATVLLVLLTLWRGGVEEKTATNTVVTAWLLSKIVARYQGAETEWGILVIDVGMLAVLTWLALRSRRYWPIAAAGFHLLAVITHLAHVVDPAVGGWAYLTAQIIWGYLVLLAIAYGAWTAPKYRTAPV